MRSNDLKPDRITAYHTRRWARKGEEIQERRTDRRYAKHWEKLDAQSAKEQIIAEATHRLLYGSERPVNAWLD